MENSYISFFKGYDSNGTEVFSSNGAHTVSNENVYETLERISKEALAYAREHVPEVETVLIQGFYKL